MVKLRASGILLGLSILLAVAQAGDYTIFKKPKAGDSAKFQMKADLRIDSSPVKLAGVVVEKIIKVETDGTYTVEESQLSGKITFKDQEIDAPKTPPATTRFKPTGEVLDFVNEQGKHDVRVANLTVFKLPTKAVKTGESWVWEQKGDKTLESVSIRGLYTIGTEEMIGKRKCLKMKQTITETEGIDPASVESTVWYDMEDWSEVKRVSKWTNLPMAGGSPVTGTITLDRIEIAAGT